MQKSLDGDVPLWDVIHNQPSSSSEAGSRRGCSGGTRRYDRPWEFKFRGFEHPPPPRWLTCCLALTTVPGATVFQAMEG